MRSDRIPTGYRAGPGVLGGPGTVTELAPVYGGPRPLTERVDRTIGSGRFNRDLWNRQNAPDDLRETMDGIEQDSMFGLMEPLNQRSGPGPARSRAMQDKLDYLSDIYQGKRMGVDPAEEDAEEPDPDDLSPNSSPDYGPDSGPLPPTGEDDTRDMVRGGPVRMRRRRRRPPPRRMRKAMRPTGYAAGGPVLAQSFGNWDAPPQGGSYAGAPPFAAPAAGGEASLGGDFSAGADSGADGGGDAAPAAYAGGGPVRRRGRHRRKSRGPGGPPPRLPRRRRPPPTGYARGGPVNPLLMSVSLDSRSKNPSHYAEDREPLSTRPARAPAAPQQIGYAQGGEVEDDEELDDEGLTNELQDLEGPDQELPGEETPAAEAPEEGDEGAGGGAQGQPQGGGADDEGGGGSGGGRGAGGGGGDPADAAHPAKTGYGQQPEPDQAEEAPAPETGYGPESAPAANPLKEVLDFTRQKLGVGETKPPAPPADPAPAPADRAQAPTQIAALPVPTGEPAGLATPDLEEPEKPNPGEAASPRISPDAPVPSLPRRGMGGSPQPSGTASGPGNPDAIKDYTSGKGGLSQDEMTQLLDRTNQQNPNLNPNDTIAQAFKNLVGKGDLETASKFVQALRPSYDNVRALMIAASSKGDFSAAMQLAEKLNNLIPNGDKVSFAPGPNGEIQATVTPEGGKPTTFQLTPEQFARYAQSPLSLFDHTAEQGIKQNLSMLTGQPGAEGQPDPRAAGQVAQMQRPGTMNDATSARPQTGYQQSRPPIERNEFDRSNPTFGNEIQRRAGEKRPGETNADIALRIAPYESQRKLRAQIEHQLNMQDRREAENARQRQYRDTPEQKTQRQQQREEGVSRRADQASKDRQMAVQARENIAWQNNVAKVMNGNAKNYLADLQARRKAWAADKSNTGEPFPETERDKQFIQHMLNTAMQHGIDFTQPRPPTSAVPRNDDWTTPDQPQRQAPAAPAPQQQAPATPTIQPRPAPAATPAAPAAPAAPQTAAPAAPQTSTTAAPAAPAADRYKLYPGNPDQADRNRPPKGIKLQPGERWLQGDQGNWRLERIPVK